jgi:hypothetical protein
LRLQSPFAGAVSVNVQTSKNTGYRKFLDSRGRAWEVWMVHPSSIERRRMERRSPVENAIFLIEQRVLGDRRAHLGTRAAVATEYSSGWLCFASNGEKRRLAPVPVNWMSANDSQVSEWCRIAKRVIKCGPTWDPSDELVVDSPQLHVEPERRKKREPASPPPPLDASEREKKE